MVFKYACAIALTLIVSYLLGSANSAIIVVKLLKHQDIRDYGSKNAGLTNTLRVYGKFPALLTLIGDLAKGIIAVLLSILIFNLIIGADGFDRQIVGYVSGFAAILGHIFPIYYGFKGGKGVLVASSILIVIDPITFCIVIPFFALILFITRYVSVASISAAVAYPIITFCTHYFIENVPVNLCILHTLLVSLTSILLIYMHRTNIKRLMNGTENKFGQKKKAEENTDSGK